QCSLEGSWKNELGSNMTVKAVDGSGLFMGSYFTAVSTQQGARIKESALSGQVQPKHPVFGFLVKWSFVESVTSWVGQCFVSQTGEERLETIWLLRGKAKTEGDDWSQTR
ncbi:AVID protein, partial [Atractosteus spatula]|nr:AVID protein [Atractosteus spatula]